jgi:hypothetical protein
LAGSNTWFFTKFWIFRIHDKVIISLPNCPFFSSRGIIINIRWFNF